jgi:DNA-binding MarR family transcriptional regulator
MSETSRSSSSRHNPKNSLQSDAQPVQTGEVSDVWNGNQPDHTDKDKELQILQEIARRNDTRQSVPQRDLAEVLGISLGMTNAILKRLAGKGWIIVKRANNRKIMYVLTPDGAQELASRSYRYFKKTIKNVVYYKERVDDVVRTAKKAGAGRVVLVGKSDLDFIVEHACLTMGLKLIRVKTVARSGDETGASPTLTTGAQGFVPGPGDFMLYGEGVRSRDMSLDRAGNGSAHLWDLVRL